MRYLDEMEKTLMERIDSLHGARECSGAVGRVRCAVKLLFLYGAFAFHRAYLLLMTDPARSFRELHRPDKNGLWSVSYADHLRFRVRMRVYAFGTAVSVLASLAITVSLVQLSDDSSTTYALTIVEVMPTDGALEFDENPDADTETLSAPPQQEEEQSAPVQAPQFAAASFGATATNNISVTSTAGAGVGTLSQAVATANGSGVNDINNIRITLAGTYELPFEMDATRRINFTNTSGGRVILDGTNLGATDACIKFDTGSSNSTLSDIQFVDCPIGVNVRDADDVTIGNATGASTVSIIGGTTGISVDTPSSDATIQYVSVGIDDQGSTDALSGDGINIKGSNGTITNSTVGNADNGINISGDDAVVQSNDIGISSTDDDIGVTAYGISISGNSATIGGTSDSLGNRVAYSGQDGLSIIGGSGHTVQNNAFFENTGNGVSISGGSGHTINDNSVGLFLANDDSTSAGGNGESGVAVSGGATGITVGTSNTIAHNDEYGVAVTGAGTATTTITQNDYENNVLGAISIGAGANNDVSAPSVSSATSSFITGTGAESGATVEVNVDGDYYADTTTVETDGSWSIDVSSSAGFTATGASVIGADVTALQTDSSGNSSAFSAAVVGANAGDAFELNTSVDTTTTTATVSVTTDEKASARLRTGTSSTSLSTAANRTTRKTSHTIELTGLRPNTTYYYKVIAENASNETVSTNVLTFSTKSSSPVLASLSGDFSVVTQPEALVFEGEVNGGTASQFRFVNPDTSDVIAVCQTDGNHVCTLPYTLSIGEYDVYFDSATNAGVTTETSGAHRLVVSPPVVTSVLTGDKRTDEYFTRVVASDTVTLVGLMPENSDINITVDGASVDADSIANTGDQSFQATLDLRSLERGRDYLVEVSFTDSDTGDALPGGLYYPIKYAHLVVEPQVSGIGSAYSLEQSATATVVAGANDILTITDNGVSYLEATLPQIDDTVQGQTTFSLPTDTVGTHTLTLQTTNSIGLSSGIQSYTYAVFGGAPTEEVLIDDEATPGTPDQTGNNPDEPGEPTDNTGDITDVAERARLKARLNNLLRTTLNIEARRLILDADGNVVEDAPLERNPNGDVVLRSARTVGLRPSTWFDFNSTNSVDVLQFSGVSEPFATVTLTIFSDPIIQVTEADDKGAWTMNVAVSDLPEGQHTAFLKSESRGVESDEVEIARFVVVQEQQLSNTSWILIANVFVALIIISIMVTVRIQHYKEEKRMKLVRAQRKPMTPEDLITELRNKQDDDDDDNDLHSTLGV